MDNRPASSLRRLCPSPLRLFLVAVLLAGSARAQEPLPRGEPGAAAQQPAETEEPSAEPEQPSIDPEKADIALTAIVRIDELRFEVVPDPKVEFFGRPRRLTEWDTDRTNLPEPAQPGVTYRDVGIRLKIVSVFEDIDRIVAEALGEVQAAEPAPPGESGEGEAATTTPELPQETAPPPPSGAPPGPHGGRR